MNIKNIKVIKKDGMYEPFSFRKIYIAMNKSAAHINHKITENQKKKITDLITKQLDIRGCTEVSVPDLHSIVSGSLLEIVPKVGRNYLEFRTNKLTEASLLNTVMSEESDYRTNGSRDNANTLDYLLSVKRSAVAKIYGKKLYQNFFLSNIERKNIKDGMYYIHDIGDRYFSRDGIINCCLADIEGMMKRGFELCGRPYTEPKTLRTAGDVFMLAVGSMTSSQYGGFTIEHFDRLLGYYAEKSYKRYFDKYMKIVNDSEGVFSYDKADKWAMDDVYTEARQVMQKITYELATCVSPRGDFPFVTISFGLSGGKFETLISRALLDDRIEGMAVNNIPAMFPKMVFLYDDKKHSEGEELEWLYKEALKCQSQTMMPDMLSLSGDGYVPEIYQKYGTTISPMGCRAFLSPWYERGGKYPADEYDKPIYSGRGNLGAISTNLVMIYIEAVRTYEGDMNDKKLFEKHFFKLLKKILKEMTNIHIKTFEETAKATASGNPLGFTQGGFLNGFLKPNDRIREVIKPFTLSFGFTALEELQYLYSGKSLYESIKEQGQDKVFANRVLKYMVDFKDKLNESTEYNFACYGTPAENLCGKQCSQVVSRYIEDEEVFETLSDELKTKIHAVCDKGYFNNSFHMAVTENITPIEKQDAEYTGFHLANGGHIQYVRVPNAYNLEANKTLMDRAMKKGYYAGININADFCEDCGERWYPEEGANLEEKCPKCNGENITQYNRVCGYIGISKASSGTRMHDVKLKDIRDRKSM